MATTTRQRPQVMTLTDQAADRIRDIVSQRDNVAGLRIGIKKGGCAGMEYTMNWSEARDPMDEVVEDKGVTVFIEPMAVMYLLGTRMDFTVDKLSSGFVFHNPNEVSACGCGESVNLVPAADGAYKADAKAD